MPIAADLRHGGVRIRALHPTPAAESPACHVLILVCLLRQLTDMSDAVARLLEESASCPDLPPEAKVDPNDFRCVRAAGPVPADPSGLCLSGLVWSGLCCASCLWAPTGGNGAAHAGSRCIRLRHGARGHHSVCSAHCCVRSAAGSMWTSMQALHNQ